MMHLRLNQIKKILELKKPRMLLTILNIVSLSPFIYGLILCFLTTDVGALSIFIYGIPRLLGRFNDYGLCLWGIPLCIIASRSLYKLSMIPLALIIAALPIVYWGFFFMGGADFIKHTYYEIWGMTHHISSSPDYAFHPLAGPRAINNGGN